MRVERQEKQKDSEKRQKLSVRLGKKPAIQKLDGLEDSLRATIYRCRLPIFVAAVTVLTFIGRVSLWPFISADYTAYLSPWLDEIRAGGGIQSIGVQIGDYSAPYHYLLALMSYLPLGNHLIIKLTSTAADYVMAAAATALCWQLLHSRWKAAVCYAVTLCLPTVFMNSAAWGQCDAMYAGLALAALALYFSGRKGWALFLYGVAFSVKLQAVFLLPAFVILWLCGRLRLRHLLCGVGGYVLLFLPAMVGAGSLSPLFAAYSMQASLLSLYANIYNGAALFSGVDSAQLEMLGPMLIMGTVVAVGIIGLHCWQKRNNLTPGAEFLLFALSACLLPFLLPAMKDRYYYLMEVLAVIYALAWPKRVPAPVIMQFVSLPAYMFYLTGFINNFQLWLVPIVGTVPLILAWDLYRHLAAPVKEEAKAVLTWVP